MKLIPVKPTRRTDWANYLDPKDQEKAKKERCYRISNRTPFEAVKQQMRCTHATPHGASPCGHGNRCFHGTVQIPTWFRPLAEIIGNNPSISLFTANRFDSLNDT